MNIVETQHWMVRMPFNAPISWGSGRREGTTRLIVRLTTNEGLVGWGETICLLDAVEPVLKNVVLPIVRQTAPFDVETLHRHVFGAGYYHHKRAAVMATSAVEMAMWDLKGKMAGLPLHRLWGGEWRTRIPMTAYIFVADDDSLGQHARAFLDAGYQTFKVKIGVDEASDIRIVAKMREIIGPDRPLRADVNGAWTPGTAKRQLAKLAAYDLQYVEQPLELDDLEGHVNLRASTSVPIALDESAYTLSDVGNIVRRGAADVVLLDPHEAGGLWPVIKQAAICESVGIPVTLHSGGELALSQAAYLHLAASIPNMNLAIDCERFYLKNDIATTFQRVEHGHMRLPDAPGLGIEPDMDAIEHYRVDSVSGAYLDTSRPGWFPVKPAY